MESYAPYTRCPAGLALVTNSGRVYGGGVIESCAYNPTLNPLQSAYIAFAAAGEANFSQAGLCPHKPVWTTSIIGFFTFHVLVACRLWQDV